jgi:PAS domain S-box-containing protein
MMTSNAQQGVHNGDEQFCLLVNAVQDYAIFMLDTAGHIVTWNTGAQLITGYRADEIIGQHFSLFYPPEDIDAQKPERELEIAKAEGVYKEEGWRLRKDRSSFWASVVTTALYDEKGILHGFGKVTRDLTERKLAEEVQRRSEEQFRLLVSEVRDYAIFMLDPKGHIASWNTGAQLIKGYRADEIIGRHFSIFYPAEDIAAHEPEHKLEIARVDGSYKEEGWRIRKDGTRFWASVVITALHDGNGELVGFSKVTRDLTERKHVEEIQAAMRQQELQLAREQEARKQAEAHVQLRDSFLSTTAHELRTPVTSLLATAQLLQRRTERGDLTPERIQRANQTIIVQAKRLNRLTTMLLDITRLDAGKIHFERAPMDIRDAIDQVIYELQLTLDHHVIALELPETPLMVEGNDVRFEQIIYNLVQNAIKYSAPGSTVRVGMQQHGQHAVITVADEGMGIRAEDLPHIFERFYRATTISETSVSGLGLGLYLVKEFVEMQGGTVDVESVVGRGTTFRVILPLIADA